MSVSIIFWANLYSWGQPWCQYHWSSTSPQNIHISYAESERGRETVMWEKESQFTIWQFSDFFSVPINLRHFYVCITETTFICSYSLTCSHPASWRHMCLYNEETYRVEISPKTWVACIYTLNTVISCILIWIWQGVTLKFKIKKFDDLAKLAQKIKPFQFE